MLFPNSRSIKAAANLRLKKVDFPSPFASHSASKHSYLLGLAFLCAGFGVDPILKNFKFFIFMYGGIIS